MTAPPVNIHGTAIVVGTTGLLFVGPSGCGKTSLAHACLSAAASRGLYARLISDDQVFLTFPDGRPLALRPDSIRNMMELRGSGIVHVPSVRRARLHHVVLPGSLAGMSRLPEEDERFELRAGCELPLVRIAREMPDPLGCLARFIPFLGLS